MKLNSINNSNILYNINDKFSEKTVQVIYYKIFLSMKMTFPITLETYWNKSDVRKFINFKDQQIA